MRVAGRGVSWQTVANRATVPGFPGQLRWPLGSGSSYPEPLASASSWYDARDILTAGQQTLASRVGSGVATFGSTSGSDFNDPVRLPHDGTNYVYLPGTTGNHLSVPKDGGWAGTMHVTATLINDTTVTFTTTASPILIGNTLLGAGRYKRFDVRDTDGAGALRVTVNPVTETLGQTSWTATTGQTVTVARSTSGLTTAVVTRPVMLFDGVDDFLQLPASDIPAFTGTTGEHTVLVLARKWHGSNTVILWSGASTALTAWFMMLSVGTTLVSWAANRLVPTPVTANGETIHARAGILDDGVTRAWDQVSGMTASSLTFLGTHLPLAWAAAPRVGANIEGGSFFPGEVFAVAAWPRALTATELNDASTYLLGTYT